MNKRETMVAMNLIVESPETLVKFLSLRCNKSLKKSGFKKFSLPGLNASDTMHGTRVVSTHTPLFNVTAIICLKKINAQA